MPQQIKRLLLVAAIFVTLLVVVRHFLVPASFGKLGHYRADAIDEAREIPPKYAGANVCDACHPDVVKIKSASRHAAINCESCHGPALAHSEDPMSTKPNKPRGDLSLCGLCHTKNTARPKFVPQIDPDEHNPGLECAMCHNVHSPKMK